MVTTYYKSRRTGLYYDGPGAGRVVPDPTAVKPSAPLVAWGVALFALGSILAGIGAAAQPTVDFYGDVSDPGAIWTGFGAVIQLAGAVALAVGAYRAAVGVDSSHRLARWNAVKDRVVEID